MRGGGIFLMPRQARILLNANVNYDEFTSRCLRHQLHIKDRFENLQGVMGSTAVKLHMLFLRGLLDCLFGGVHTPNAP